METSPHGAIEWEVSQSQLSHIYVCGIDNRDLVSPRVASNELVPRVAAAHPGPMRSVASPPELRMRGLRLGRTPRLEIECSEDHRKSKLWSLGPFWSQSLKEPSIDHCRWAVSPFLSQPAGAPRSRHTETLLAALITPDFPLPARNPSGLRATRNAHCSLSRRETWSQGPKRLLHLQVRYPELILLAYH